MSQLFCSDESKTALPADVAQRAKDLNRLHQIGRNPGGALRTSAEVEADHTEAYRQLGEIIDQYPEHTDKIVDLFGGPTTGP